jgi:hypothetical protein
MLHFEKTLMEMNLVELRVWFLSIRLDKEVDLVQAGFHTFRYLRKSTVTAPVTFTKTNVADANRLFQLLNNGGFHFQILESPEIARIPHKYGLGLF